MAWHVKKHASGSKYEKIEDPEKLEWVKRVIDHQKCLLSELEKIKKEQIEKEFKQNETIITEKKLSKYPSKDVSNQDINDHYYLRKFLLKYFMILF